MPTYGAIQGLQCQVEKHKQVLVPTVSHVEVSTHNRGIGVGIKQLGGGVMSRKVYTEGRNYLHGELDGVNKSIQQDSKSDVDVVM